MHNPSASPPPPPIRSATKAPSSVSFSGTPSPSPPSSASSLCSTPTSSRNSSPTASPSATSATFLVGEGLAPPLFLFSSSIISVRHRASATSFFFTPLGVTYSRTTKCSQHPSSNLSAPSSTPAASLLPPPNSLCTTPTP